MATWRLTVWSVFAASPEAVFAYKTDPDRLRHELGPLVRATTADPEALARAMRHTGDGAFDLRLTGPIGLVGVTWPVQIVRSDPPRSYQDDSVNASFLAWRHEHRVEPVTASLTRYVDDVTFTPRARPSVLTAAVMRALFVHRHQRAARDLPAQDVGRTWLRRDVPRGG